MTLSWSTRIHDVSAPLTPMLPVWPGQKGLRRRLVLDLNRGDPATVSDLCVGAHTGTHVDAPAHFIAGGLTIDSLPLDVLVGPAEVVDLSTVKVAISAADLDRAQIAGGTTRLLAKTRNSGWSRARVFDPDFVSFDPSGADWCVAHGIRLVGIDYLSVEAPNGVSSGNPVHHRLLGAGVVILEGLELKAILPSSYALMAMPILASRSEAAPARVFLLDRPPAIT